ncbi:hypothetical protein AIOL_000957 [Candidatus Rhodobacter oscarellae]|uniref:Uncharacterized protein n=1 Tax=Candidatus Rhodobacter oscarellae TaxID=1675527 RepID=A0A0J9EDA6_9RHOB|nr:hypothetical protein [Candidatus Rhodobacter lobularis]KMW60792.1 hypothetical protein AIOL_000957 [Candidatus Rhodobacter lobularis]
MGLENSISEMIERQDSLSDKADAAENRHETYMGQTSPGLQPLLGLAPNQCGVDTSGDGLPDGWYLPANDGFTSWAHAGQTTTGAAATEIPSGGIEEEFYNGIPNSPNPSFRNHSIHFWRFSWDLTAGGAPATIAVLSYSNVPFTGMMGMWVKEEVPGVLDHRVWGLYDSNVVRGQNDWAVWASRQTPRSDLSYPGNYHHARLDLDTAQIPNAGSIIVAAPQILSTVFPVDVAGWGVFPGLNRINDNGDFRHGLSYVTNQWEFK